jgi:hypothetical protein
MPFTDKPAGLFDPPPLKSKVTRQEIRYTTLAGAYHVAPAIIPLTPTMFPLPHNTVSNQTFPVPLPLNLGGLMLLGGRAAVQVVSSLNDNARRDFPAETYAQVKRHVVSQIW